MAIEGAKRCTTHRTNRTAPTRTREQAEAEKRAEKKQSFITALSERGIVQRACDASGLARRTVYDWYEADPDFAAAWDAALETATDAMEDEARRPAVDGVNKPVFQGGILVGHIREYSDTLLTKMLAANRPEKYRDRMEVTGKGGGAIRHDFNFQSLDEAQTAIEALDAEFDAIVAGLAADDGGREGEG